MPGVAENYVRVMQDIYENGETAMTYGLEKVAQKKRAGCGWIEDG